MSNKKGIVMETTNKAVYVLSSNGEFYKLKLKGTQPNIGEEYFGEEINEMGLFNHFNKVAVAASLSFAIFSSTAAYAYYKPVSTVLLTGSSAIELKSNRFNRVISAKSLNDSGKNIMSKVTVNNKSVDDALVDILNELPKNNAESIDLKVTGKSIKVDKFKSSIMNNKLNVKLIQNDKIEEVTKEENNNSKGNSYEKYEGNSNKAKDDKNINIGNSSENVKKNNRDENSALQSKDKSNNGVANKKHNIMKEDINNKNNLNKNIKAKGNENIKSKDNEIKNENNNK